jgi:cytochrome c biogenesis protein CcmG/thiol:disulfide interchange protein DsbE
MLGFLSLLASQLLTPASQGALGTVSSPLLGQNAPDFTLPLLDPSSSSTLHLARLKGTPVVINFWASWCDACKEEAPLFQQTWQQVQSQGVRFIGIDFEDTQSAGLGFLRHYGVTYPNVTDTSGSVAIDYGVSGVPETFFINRQGVIVQKIIGAVQQHAFQQAIEHIESAT